MPRNKTWFRCYDRMIDSPEMLELDSDTFRLAVSLWCVASAGGNEDGHIPYRNAALWRRTVPMFDREIFDKSLQVLLDEGLLLGTEGDYYPANWARHQYLYDSKKPSVRAMAEKRKQHSEDVGKFSGSDREVLGKSLGSDREAFGKQDSDTDSDTENPKTAVEDGGSQNPRPDSKAAHEAKLKEAFNATFWPVYPKKRDKAAAFRAFKKLFPPGQAPETKSRIWGNLALHLTALHEEFSGRPKEDLQYCKNASTWLNAVDFDEAPENDMVPQAQQWEVIDDD